MDAVRVIDRSVYLPDLFRDLTRGHELVSPQIPQSLVRQRQVLQDAWQTNNKIQLDLRHCAIAERHAPRSSYAAIK